MDDDTCEPDGLNAHAKRIFHGYANPARALMPPINWWKGKLRPFESPLSFAACFCALNGITTKQHELFFGYELGEEWQLSHADLERIALLIQEDLSSVQSVFIPTIQLLQPDSYAARQSLDGLRYCRQCAALGYHSHFHDLAWLKRCPFHLTTLEWMSSHLAGTNKVTRNLHRLMSLMRSNCQEWPRTDEGDLVLQQRIRNGYVPLLQAWTKHARETAMSFSRGTFWDSYPSAFAAVVLSDIGRLRRLEPMPHPIALLVTDSNEVWDVDIRHFSEEVKAELRQLTSAARFRTIFDFYKRVAGRASHPPPFVQKLRAAQHALHVRHGNCRCHWGRERAGWVYHWVKTDPGWPNWRIKCPYQVAIEELELNWGDPSCVLSPRLAYKELLDFIVSSRVIRDAGLINYIDGASISPAGYLHAYPQIWPCCEWNASSPLTDLLNTAAEFEVDSAVIEITEWLDAIDESTPPSGWNEIEDLICLREEDEGLSLVRWIRTHAPEG